MDWIAVERPLLMELSCEQELGSVTSHKIAMTLRTPGADSELMLGYLLTEGILTNPDQVLAIKPGNNCALNKVDRIILSTKPGLRFDLKALERHGAMTSACGACGKVETEQLFQNSQYHAFDGEWQVRDSLIYSLAQAFNRAQDGFYRTGGMHAAALFNERGDLQVLREDVGRHNALDKMIGYCAMQKRLPLRRSILVLSGRISFELVQKAGMAGIPLIVAFGSPSSLAIETAKRFGITLIGFLKSNSFSIYACQQRVHYAKKS